MRITGGAYRGRNLTAPKGMDVRPASDKVRLAVFNSLLSKIDLEGAQILDGFCGTGSYGLEALSRGAAAATFIDLNRKSLEACTQNVAALDLNSRTKIIASDVLKLKQKPEDIPAADLCFLDPPYRKGLLQPALNHLIDMNWLAPDALCVLECERDLDIPFGNAKIYGDVKVIFYSRS